MPETPLQSQALDALRHDIPARWAGATELTPAEITARFPKRSRLVAAWRVPVAMIEPPGDLLVLVDDKFPWALPLIALPSAPNKITYPHVETDGNLCLVPTNRPYILPVGIEHVAQLIESAAGLLLDGAANSNAGDFLSEAHSYWCIRSSSLASLWLTESAPQTHAVWYGMRQITGDWALGPGKDELRAWAKNAGRPVGELEPCLVIRLDAPLFPQDYPVSVADLVNFANQAGAQKLLSMALSRWSGRRVMPVVIAFSHNDADICLGAGFLPPGEIRLPGSRQAGIPGFRKGGKTLPQAFLKANVPMPRLPVVPIYRESLLARTAGAVPEAIRKAHVAIIGCGALGGELAVQLVKAGVGKLTLVDPDIFDWRNVGRHVMDGTAVGLLKAPALAQFIKQSFPDVHIEAYKSRWEELNETERANVVGADLVVCATGEAASNLHLDALVHAGEMPATIYAFIEAFAVAGHAILQVPGGGRLNRVATANGVLREPVLDVVPELPQEPACGAVYQPYSSLAALACVSVAGELALDALMGHVTVSAHRVWIGSVGAATRNGLALSSVWRQRINEAGDNRRFDLPLPACD